jgi:cell division protein FtsQ
MSAWHDARLLNGLANVVFAGSLAACLAAGAWWLSNRPMFTIQNIQVQAEAGHALKHLEAATVHEGLGSEVSGNFFHTSLDGVRHAFEALPWVRRATVRRVWPNALEVSIEEHRPLALWNDQQLMNTFGEIYSVKHLDGLEQQYRLPRFNGPQGTEQLVAQRHAEFGGQLAALNLRIDRIDLSDRQAWTLHLNDGVRVLLGRDAGSSGAERLARWVSLHPSVGPQLKERPAVFDLRYANGYSMRMLAHSDTRATSSTERSTPGAVSTATNKARP